MANITLDDIINISATLSPAISYRKTLNSALFIAEKAGESKIEAEDRIIEVNSLADLVDAGLDSSSCEYKSIALYFSQNPAPIKCYLGFISTYELTNNLIGEVITECRANNYEWYVLVPVDTLVTKLNKEQIATICTTIQGSTPESMLALNVTSENTNYEEILESVKNDAYTKIFVQYDNMNYGKTAIAGIIGYALGYNKRISTSFTLAYKTVVGLTPVDISKVDIKALMRGNINIYVTQGHYYNLFRQGVMASGDHFDEIYYIDMLINDLRSELMTALISNPKIPQTVNGTNIIAAKISAILDQYVDIQFIQSGIWLGTDVLNLSYGDMLSSGYLIQFDEIDTQTATERASRVAPNCYICAKLAGAIEYITLGISVSR